MCIRDRYGRFSPLSTFFFSDQAGRYDISTRHGLYFFRRYPTFQSHTIPGESLSSTFVLCCRWWLGFTFFHMDRNNGFRLFLLGYGILSSLKLMEVALGFQQLSWAYVVPHAWLDVDLVDLFLLHMVECTHIGLLLDTSLTKGSSNTSDLGKTNTVTFSHYAGTISATRQHSSDSMPHPGWQLWLHNGIRWSSRL